MKLYETSVHFHAAFLIGTNTKHSQIHILLILLAAQLVMTPRVSQGTWQRVRLIGLSSPCSFDEAAFDNLIKQSVVYLLNI